jgi:hypothetical protein
MPWTAKQSIAFLWFVFTILNGSGNSLLGKNAEEASALSRFLPQELSGWRAEGKDELYDPETIFGYIDGAGEVYRAYNFQSLTARRYLKEGQPNLVADFFDMGTAADAFGVFTHDLEGEALEVGQGAVYKGGLLSFWKDRYFVSLYSEGETAQTRPALAALGEAIAKAIRAEGIKPNILFYVPSSFDVGRARYFHNHLILNYHFFVSTENILLLDQKTEAVLVSPTRSPDNAFLLIVRYSDIKTAANALQNYTKSFMLDAAKAGLFQTEDKKWTAAENKGKYVVIFFNAVSAVQAKEITAEVVGKIAD